MRIVDRIEAGVTFVDGLGVGDVEDVALRDRRRLSEDGVLIVVTTVALSDGGEIAPPEVIARGVAEDDELIDELREEADRIVLRARAPAGSRRSSSCRSTSTTGSGSSSTTARGAGR